RTRTVDLLLTILVQVREARARPGPRGHGSAANRWDLTTRRDPCMSGCGRADVRTSFARWLALVPTETDVVTPARLGSNGLSIHVLSNQGSTDEWWLSGGGDDHLFDLRHVEPGCGRGLFRRAAALARVDIGGVPVPPVVRWGDCLVGAVMFLRLVQEICQGCDVHLGPPFFGEPWVSGMRWLALAVLASWSIGGLFFSLGPALGAQLLASTNAIVAEIGIVTLTGTAAVAQLVLGRTRPWLAASA